MLDRYILYTCVLLCLILSFIYFKTIVFAPKLKSFINYNMFSSLFELYQIQIEFIFYVLTFILCLYNIFKSYKSLDFKEYNLRFGFKIFLLFVSIFFLSRRLFAFFLNIINIFIY